MKFEYYNPNPDAKTFKSGKPKSWNRNDSGIRAICKYMNYTWEDTFETLSEISKNLHDIPISKNVINEYCNQNNIKYFTLGKPTAGQKRPTVSEFIQKYSTGKYILYLRDYYITVDNGVVYDVDNKLEDEAVYSYWSNEELV